MLLRLLHDSSQLIDRRVRLRWIFRGKKSEWKAQPNNSIACGRDQQTPASSTVTEINVGVENTGSSTQELQGYAVATSEDIKTGRTKTSTDHPGRTMFLRVAVPGTYASPAEHGWLERDHCSLPASRESQPPRDGSRAAKGRCRSCGPRMFSCRPSSSAFESTEETQTQDCVAFLLFPLCILVPI